MSLSRRRHAFIFLAATAAVNHAGMLHSLHSKANQGILALMKTSLLPIGPDAPWLAPLAGFSDLPFRLLCRELGAAVTCTEMVSAKGLVYGMRQGGKGSTGTDDLLSTTPQDAPLVVQLFGAEADFIAEAATLLCERGFTWFDLNMGCSVPKVNKTGAGSAMLRDVENAVAVAKALIAAVGPGRTGFKLRLGWDATSVVYLELAKALEDAGAAWITLHPRFAKQGFTGVPDASALERLARAVSIPVLASGDLFCAADGIRALETGAQGVMFARGAMANPAIFQQYRALRAGQEAPEALPPQELLAIIHRHAELARDLTPGKPGRRGYSPALLKMRTVVPRYVRHLPGVKQLRLALAGCESWENLDTILREFFAGEYGAGDAAPDELGLGMYGEDNNIPPAHECGAEQEGMQPCR